MQVCRDQTCHRLACPNTPRGSVPHLVMSHNALAHFLVLGRCRLLDGSAHEDMRRPSKLFVIIIAAAAFSPTTKLLPSRYRRGGSDSACRTMTSSPRLIHHPSSTFERYHDIIIGLRLGYDDEIAALRYRRTSFAASGGISLEPQDDLQFSLLPRCF